MYNVVYGNHNVTCGNWHDANSIFYIAKDLNYKFVAICSTETGEILKDNTGYMA